MILETMGCVTVFVSNNPDGINWRWLKQLFGYHGKCWMLSCHAKRVDQEKDLVSSGTLVWRMRKGPLIEWTSFECLIIDSLLTWCDSKVVHRSRERNRRFYRIDELEKDIYEKDIMGATIMRLSGSVILMVFESVEMLEFDKANQWDILDSCFMHKQWWSDKIKTDMNSSMDTFSGDKEDVTKEVDRILQAVKDLVLSVGANEGKGDDDRILNVLGLLLLYGR
ncbi:hypothetical protein Goshw_022074, partial [Gossypium schwendimanii]|nr:hypothetical protein [Gossypium schwendimanii]